MTRKSLNKSYRLEIVSVNSTFVDSPPDWLAAQANAKRLTLLAHADDGAIWGKLENGQLFLSGDVFEGISPPLRAATLQQLWLFGDEVELYLWRIEPNRFSARWLTETDSSQPDCLEEAYLLWGTSAEASKDGFTLLTDGQQGLKHAVPLSVQVVGRRPLSLIVRHYLAYDADGQAYIKVSRLVRLTEGGQHA
jgi:CRISPR-associated protein (TIGR03984 family)